MWLVFYVKNARIASLQLNDKNIDGMRAFFCMSLIQTDATGTQHWNIMSPWGKSPQGQEAQKSFIEKYGEKEFKKLKVGYSR